ncbi:YIEGIA family protein [Marinicrinis sediminis]|uniref:YIEGIA family protein n=1 Tax=Marinicrinis sediminis TaxID=1652465 RepID=A0ABW5RDX4_9BACL
MFDYMFSDRYTLGVVLGTLFGIIARFYMLQTDYRQYPTYPHGRIIHVSLGIIAAGLGAVAVPALFEEDYTAITFLALAAQQFRDVRNMERETLTNLDEMELVPRGAVYIEGIAMVFEGRNYLVILSAFLASLFTILLSPYAGIVGGVLSLFVARYFKSGKSVSEIADIEIAPVKADDFNIYVGDIYIMNVGLKESQDIIAQQGIGLIFTPKNRNSRVSLANLGQRQAILHDMSTIFGAYRDSSEPSLLPLAKLDMKDGRLGVLLLVCEVNPEKAVEAARSVPLLESAVRMPSEASANQTSREATKS